MSGPRYLPRLLATLIVAVFVGGLGSIALNRFGDRPPPAPGPSLRSVSDEPAGRVDSAGATAASPRPEMAHALELAAIALRTGPGTPENSRKLLMELFHQLDSAPPAERRAALAEFLAAGSDAPTGLAYSVGPGGFLRSWPTLRVALLDYAGRLEADTMRALAEMVLVEPGSPDEWSVALRNLARVSPSGDTTALLVDRAHRLLANEAWAAAPSIGYLEAFDVLVHTRLLGELGRLEALMARDRPREVRFAAFLTTDRLIQLEPRDTLALLAREPALFSTTPSVRASLFARADVRDADQRAALESYLARPDRSDAERTEFGGLFPNHNTTFSHNLLTPPVSLRSGEMIARDRASLEAVRAWRLQPHLAAWSGALAEVEKRLNTHLSQIR